MTVVNNAAHALTVLCESEHKLTADSAVAGDNALKLISVLSRNEIGHSALRVCSSLDKGVFIKDGCNLLSYLSTFAFNKRCAELCRIGELADFGFFKFVQT